jgi:FlaA1/EpsC-like NDP-sugar epimerase
VKVGATDNLLFSILLIRTHYFMNVLVTGGAGYIGSMLVRQLLSDGHQVRVVDLLHSGGESIIDLLDSG